MSVIYMNQILANAITYFENNDRLIYSYRGNTFLQGGELFDVENGNRGRIDCSTLVHLALQGIPYSRSPYASGNAEEFFGTQCRWLNDGEGKTVLSDVFADRGDRASDIRRAYGLAKYCRESGLELDGGEKLKPGDLVFFRAPQSVLEEYYRYGAYLGISHVGIVAEDTEYMINATGSSNHALNAARRPVRISRIERKGPLLIRARLEQK